MISIDAELGWGHHDREDPPERRLANARRGWSRLGDLLDRYQVPATWAVVGHLMLEDCDGVHADHPLSPEWFARESGEWDGRPELRFAPDLVDDVLSADVDHELACHGFSHAPLDHVHASRRVMRAELDACIEVARAWDVEFSSFVYPRNRIGHRDVLAEYGFTCFRGSSPKGRHAIRTLRPFQKVARGTVTSPATVTPTIDEHRLVDVPGSMYLFGFEGWLRTAAEALWADPMVEQAERGIDAVAGRDGGVFHVWFHPNDLRSPRDVVRVERFLRYLADRREETPLEVETMAEVAARTLQGETRSRAGRSSGD